MNDFVARCREWQAKNTDYTLMCDTNGTDIFYVQWNELSKSHRMAWIGKYGRAAKDAFEEFAIKKCKVPQFVLTADMRLLPDPLYNWPHGDAMLVFQTKQDGVPLV